MSNQTVSLSASGVQKLQNLLYTRFKIITAIVGVIFMVASAWYALQYQVVGNTREIEKLERRIERLEEIWK